MHSHLQGHPALADAIRKLERLNPDQFELYFERKRTLEVESKDQEIDSLERAEDVGLAIRIVKDRRIGFSYTTSLEKSAIEKAAQAAFDVAAFMPQDPYVELQSFGSSVYPELDIYDVGGLKVPAAEKIALAKQLESECRKVDARIKGVRSASIREIEGEVHLVDSNGEHVSHKSTVYTASVTCRAEENGDNQMGGDFAFSNFLDNLEIKKVATTAALLATELLGAQSPPTLQCPAVLRNTVVAELIDFLSSSFSGEAMDKGRSMLAGKMGERIFSDQVTLIDDGLLPNGLGSSPFDAEGTPSSKTVLVDGGLMNAALYDTYYARKRGTEPTGNAGRGIKSPPSIGISNLYMQNGKKPFQALLEGISRGILITDLMGVHTANPVTGDFSLGASGILIEKGKLTRPVKGFAVAGNVLELFRKMTDISNDLKFTGSVGAPSVRVAEISVGGA